MKRFFIILFLTMIYIGCGNDPISTDDPPNIPPPEVYDFDSLSAAIACWYFNTQYPDSSKAQKIHDDMQLIVSEWADTLDIINDTIDYRGSGWDVPDFKIANLKFIPPWKMSRIRMTVFDVYADSIEQGIYSPFQTILDSLEYDSVVVSNWLLNSSLRYINLYLTGTQNSLPVALKFKTIPNILAIELIPGVLVGGTSNIYPYFEGGYYKYFYNFAWGDCPSGCIYSRVYYFSVEDGQAKLIDIHDFSTDTLTTPTWADSARFAGTKWRYPWWNDL